MSKELELSKYSYLEVKGLPKLPVPKLDDTLNQYLETVSVLITEEQLKETKKIVEEFRKGEGQKLQQELLNLSKETPTSYLEGFWDTMYYTLRCPNTIHVNPYFGMVDDSKRTDLVSRASNITIGVIEFHQKIRDGKKELDLERTTPLCMTQYGKLFCATRIPEFGRDIFKNHKDSQHVLVICNDQFYRIDVVDEEGKNIKEEELQYNLKLILEDSKKNKVDLSVSTLTSEDRNKWAAIRKEMIKSKTNVASLNDIETAIFALVLESNTPKNRHEYSQYLLAGIDGKNRWFDKSIQIIVTPNGKAGINMEHSGFDGHTILYLAHHLWIVKKRDLVKPLSNGVVKFKKLNWDLSNSQVVDGIKAAEKSIKELIDTTTVKVLDFEDYGANFMKENGISPDAYIQVCYQLAYYKLYKKPGSTYESANTKQFHHGRTETIRSCTKDSLNFSRKYLDSNTSNIEKEALFRKAAETHVKVTAKAKSGHGIDRHLYVLHNLSKHKRERLPNYEIPSIFTDVAYSILKTDLVSTSNSSGTPGLDLFGFGPVCSEGVGLGYIVENNALRINITSFKNRDTEYFNSLKSVFTDIKSLLLDNKKKESK